MGFQGPALLTPCWGVVDSGSAPPSDQFLEWGLWLGERKELWKAISSSLVGLEILLQALEF